MKKKDTITFHEGDFYRNNEHTPLFNQDGKTEFYYHLLCDLNSFHPLITPMVGLKREIGDLKRSLKALKKKLEKVKLPGYKYTIGQVK